MRNKNYSRPYQVRLHTVQEDTLNKIMNDNKIIQKHNYNGLVATIEYGIIIE